MAPVDHGLLLTRCRTPDDPRQAKLAKDLTYSYNDLFIE